MGQPELRRYSVDKLSILDRLPFYREASVADRAEIAAAAVHVTLAPGANLYREGDVCGEFFVVGSGTVRVLKVGETGREITLYHVQDGESCLVNTLSVLQREPAVAAARVETQVEVVLLAGATVRKWVRTRDWIRTYMIAMTARRLIDVVTLIEEVVFGRMDSRLARLLLQEFGAGRFFGATHEEIAAQLGTAREVVSRLLKEFERQGAIRLGRGRIELLDEAALRERNILT